jgi:hypothetical protein
MAKQVFQYLLEISEMVSKMAKQVFQYLLEISEIG